MPREAEAASQNTIAAQMGRARILNGVQLGVAQLSAFLNDFGDCVAEKIIQPHCVFTPLVFVILTARVSRVCVLADAATRGRLSALDEALAFGATNAGR